MMFGRLLYVAHRMRRTIILATPLSFVAGLALMVTVFRQH